MQLAQLQSDFKAVAQGRTVVLDSNTYQSKPITALFGRFFGAHTLTLASTNISVGKDNVVIQGKCPDKVFNVPNLSMYATFTEGAKGLQFELEVYGFANDWTLNKSFPKLDNTALAEFGFETVTFYLRSHPTTKVENIRHELNLPPAEKDAKLRIKEGLYIKVGLLVGAMPKMANTFMQKVKGGTFEMEGPVQMVGDIPRFKLRSTTNAPYELIGEKMELEMQLVSVLPETSARTLPAEGYLRFIGHRILDFGSKQVPGKLQILTSSLQEKKLTVQILADSKKPIALSLEDLTSPIGLSGAASYIPATLGKAEDFSFNRMGADLNLPKLDIAKSYVRLNWEKDYSFFSDHLKLSGLKVQFAATKGASGSSFAVKAFSSLTFHDDVTMNATMVLPALTLTASLAEDNTIDIKALLKKIAKIPKNSLPTLTCSSFELSADIAKSSYSGAITLDQDWSHDLGHGVVFSLSSMQGNLDYDKEEGLAVAISGQTDIAQQLLYPGALPSGTKLQMSATYSKEKGWTMECITLPGQQFSLSLLVSQMAKIFGANINDYVKGSYLENLKISYQTKTKDFGITGMITSGTTQKLKILGKTFEVALLFNIKRTDGKFTGSVTGVLEIANMDFALEYDVTKQSKSITAYWEAGVDPNSGNNQLATLSLNALLDGLNLPNASAYSKVKVSFVAISLSYNITNESLTIAAKTEAGDTAFIEAGSFSGEWGFVLGYEMGTDSIKKMLGIGSEIDVLDIDQAALIVSSHDIPNFTLPQLPTIKGVATSTFSEIMGQVGFELPVGLSAVLNVDFSQAHNSSDLTVAAAAKMVSQNQLNSIVSVGPQGVSLAASLVGNVSIGPPSNQLTLQHVELKFLWTPTLAIEFICLTQMKLGSTVLEATGAIDVNVDSVVGTMNLKAEKGEIPNPIDLKGLHLKDFGFSLDFTYEPPALGFGLETEFTIGPPNTQVQYNDTAGLDKFIIVLMMEEEVPNPEFVSFYMQQLSLGEVVTLFTNKRAPAMLDVVQADDLSFYWAEEVTTLPDNTQANPGFGFSAWLDIFGFKAFADFHISVTRGIHGRAQMKPIHLFNDYFKVTGDGQPVMRKMVNGKMVPNGFDSYPNVQPTVWLEGGGPEIEVSSSGPTFFHSSWDIVLFGKLMSSIDVTINTDGASFKYVQSVAVIGTLTLESQLDFKKVYFHAEADFNFKLDITISVPDIGQSLVKGGEARLKSFASKIPFLSNGLNLHVDSDMDVSLSLTITDSYIKMKASGDFEFDGNDLHLPEFTIEVDFDKFDFKHLPKIIEDEILDKAEDIFKDIFSEVKGEWGKLEHLATHLYGESKTKVAELANGAAKEAQHVASQIEGLGKGMVKEAQGLVNSVSNETQSIIKEGQKAVHTMEQEGQKAVNHLKQLGEGLEQNAKHTIAQTVATFNSFKYFAEKTTSHLKDTLTQDVNKVVQGVQQVAQRTIHFIEDKFKQFEHTITDKINQLAKEGQRLLNWANDKLNVVKQKLQDIKNKIQGVIQDINKLVGNIAKSLEALTAAIAHDFEKLKKIIGEISGSIGSLGSSISGTFKNIESDIGSTLSEIDNVATSVINDAGSVASTAYNKTKDGFSTGINAIGSIF